MSSRSIFRAAMVAVLVIFLIGAALYVSDPINRLGIRLLWEDFHSLGWRSGFWTLVKAPADAQPQDLVSALYTLPYQAPSPFEILETKNTHMGASSQTFTVVLVVGPHGRKIAIFSRSSDEWSAREYDP